MGACRFSLAIPVLLGVAACTRPHSEPHPERQVQPPVRSAEARPRLARLGYTIQVGAFAQASNAVRLSEKLQSQGLDATYYLSDRQLYRVRFGDFPSKDAARERAEKLKLAGVIETYYLVSPDEKEPGKPRSQSEGGVRDQIAETARSYLGVPYLWGGTTEKGFDCSGLAQGVYRLNGLRLPRSSRDQYEAGTPVSLANLQKGDLVFFSTNGSGQVSHVGVYMGEGTFIHAPSRGKSICTERLSESYYQKRWVGARSYL